MIGRRRFAVAAAGTLLGLAGAAAAPTRVAASALPSSPRATLPRTRLLFVNDLCGDVDGLFAAVHALLSPSLDVRGIVGTAATAKHETAERSVVLARELLAMLPDAGPVPVHAGSNGRMKDDASPIPSEGASAIIAEAMRDDKLPLYVVVGGGLTEVASALMIEPAIASRLTLIWIGGEPHPAGGRGEYNFGIDPIAAQHVFNGSDVPLWQVPSDAYGTCLVSTAEIAAYVAPEGKIGAWLAARLETALGDFSRLGVNGGETWTLGDSPLVLLTALTGAMPSRLGKLSLYEKTPSSRFDEVARPTVDRKGFYMPGRTERKIRVYRTLDTRVMLDDMYAKLSLNARRERGGLSDRNI